MMTDNNFVINLEETLIQNITLNDPDMVRYALDLGANVNHRGDLMRTPLLLAVVKRFRHACVEALLSRPDININAVDSFRYNALYYALLGQDSEYTYWKMLLEHGIDVNYKMADGSTMLMYLLYGYDQNNMTSVKLLLDFGADTYIIGPHKMNAYQYARKYKGQYSQIVDLIKRQRSRLAFAAAEYVTGMPRDIREYIKHFLPPM